MSEKNSSEAPTGYAASIFLPQVFRNMKNAKLFAVDIGEKLEWKTKNSKHQQWMFLAILGLITNQES